MITPWTIYWITRLDELMFVLTPIFIIGIIAALIAGTISIMITVDNCWDEDNTKTFKFLVKWWLIIMIPVTLIGTLVPDTKQAAAIYLIPKIANNEQIQKLPDNAGKFLNAELEKWIEDLNPAKKEKK